MRFAALGGSNVGDYAAAGKAVADSASKSFEVQRKTGPDYGKLSQVAMKTAAEEKMTSMAASAKVAKAGINAYEGTVKQGNKIAVFNKQEDIKTKQKMAGGVAAVGKMIGVGYLSKDNEKGRERPRGDSSGIYDEYKTERDRLNREHDESIAAVDSGNSTPVVTKTVPSASTADTADTVSGSNTGGSYNMQEMTDLAIQGGFSPENARIMAAISRGESGGNAGTDTVQSGLDPNKSNEYSIGLSQINVQAHSDKLNRRGWTEEDLRDPVKNMTIAKEVYDEAGSFKPWSVYQKGLHTQYLN